MLIKKRISIVYFLKLIVWDAAAILFYAIAVGILDHMSFFSNITIPFALSALVGTLLSLLLAFRTSQSYERWWEARVVWGAIVNDSRTLIRQLQQFLPADEQKQHVIQSFVERQTMWCYALANSLRNLEMTDRVKDYCAKHGIAGENIPNLLLTRHAEELSAITTKYAMDPNRQVQLDSTLQRLTDAMGRCERIKSTVFPRSYSLMVHFLIYVLMTILPFGLDDNNVFVEMFLVTLIPVLFIAIEQTSILMQDPFENKPTDTPMTTLSATIERNLLEMTGQEVPPKMVAGGSYYVM
jgi:putative membrane protein